MTACSFPHLPPGTAASAGRPTLSVVITARNAQSRLRPAVTSLLRDAPDELEIIVADDGLGTGAGSGAEQLAAEDARVRIICPPGTGSGAARNAALAAASGDYVGFLGEGHEAEPGWARTLLAAAAARPAIIKGEVRLFAGERELSGPRSCAVMAQRTPLHWLERMWSAIYRRDFVQGHDLHFVPEGGRDAEEDFRVRALVAALLDHEEIALCPQAVCRERLHPGRQPDSMPDRRQAACSLDIYAALHELFLEQYPRLPPEGVGAQYCSWITALFALARRARHPQDAAAASALAQRLNRECPCPDELERERLAQEFGVLPPPHG